jgi:glutaredoxin 3
VKEFLSQKGISFIDRDVSVDEKVLEELSDTGYMTTPVIKIDGEVIVGFNRNRLEEILA